MSELCGSMLPLLAIYRDGLSRQLSIAASLAASLSKTWNEMVQCTIEQRSLAREHGKGPWKYDIGADVFIVGLSTLPDRDLSALFQGAKVTLM